MGAILFHKKNHHSFIRSCIATTKPLHFSSMAAGVEVGATRSSRRGGWGPMDLLQLLPAAPLPPTASASSYLPPSYVSSTSSSSSPAAVAVAAAMPVTTSSPKEKSIEWECGSACSEGTGDGRARQGGSRLSG